jgi:hypothetical protein
MDSARAEARFIDNPLAFCAASVTIRLADLFIPEL